jgi:hypothetical protein
VTWWLGWNSIASTGWWSHFWFWFGIACLFALGGAEVVSHIYGLRKDELVAAAESAAAAQRQADTNAAETRRKTEVEALQKQLGEANKKVGSLQAQYDVEHNAKAQLRALFMKIDPQILRVIDGGSTKLTIRMQPSDITELTTVLKEPDGSKLAKITGEGATSRGSVIMDGSLGPSAPVPIQTVIMIEVSPDLRQ